MPKATIRSSSVHIIAENEPPAWTPTTGNSDPGIAPAIAWRARRNFCRETQEALSVNDAPDCRRGL